MAGCHDLSGGRTAPSFVTIISSEGYGSSASRMIWLVTCGAIVVGRVDMVHAGDDRLAEGADGSVGVLWRTPHTGASQLHRAVAHPVNRQ